MRPTTESLVDSVNWYCSTVEEVALLCAMGIKDSMSSIDWAAVKAATVKTHSTFFWLAVKRRAWQIVEQTEAQLGIGERES